MLRKRGCSQPEAYGPSRESIRERGDRLGKIVSGVQQKARNGRIGGEIEELLHQRKPLRQLAVSRRKRQAEEILVSGSHVVSLEIWRRIGRRGHGVLIAPQP